MTTSTTYTCENRYDCKGGNFTKSPRPSDQICPIGSSCGDNTGLATECAADSVSLFTGMARNNFSKMRILLTFEILLVFEILKFDHKKVQLTAKRVLTAFIGKMDEQNSVILVFTVPLVKNLFVIREHMVRKWALVLNLNALLAQAGNFVRAG